MTRSPDICEVRRNVRCEGRRFLHTAGRNAALPFPARHKLSALFGLTSAGVIQHRTAHASTGFCGPCSVAASWSRLGLFQIVVCLRSPDEWPVAFSRTAYQQGPCCQW